MDEEEYLEYLSNKRRIIDKVQSGIPKFKKAFKFFEEHKLDGLNSDEFNPLFKKGKSV